MGDMAGGGVAKMGECLTHLKGLSRMIFGKGEGTRRVSFYSIVAGCRWDEKGSVCVKARKVEETMLLVTTPER